MTKVNLVNQIFLFRRIITPLLVVIGLMSSLSASAQTPDIQVTQTVDKITADEGATIVYTITVKSAQNAATTVSIADTLPGNVTYVSHTVGQGTFNTATGIWDVGALAKNATSQLKITVTINGGTSGTSISNTAKFYSSTLPDITPNNNSATASTTINTADLSLLKTVDDNTPNQGQTISYTIKISNAGPGFGGNIIVTDTIPLSETFVTVTTLPVGTWSYDNTRRVLQWNIPSLLTATNKSLVYTATINTGTATQTISNTSYISGFDQVDNTAANNKSSVSVTVNPQDVKVAKTVNVTTADEGSNVIYTITATNLSGGDLSALSILDTLPSKLTYVSYTADAGSYDAGTGIWEVGALADLAAKNLYLTAKVNGGTSNTSISNTAKYFSSTPADNISTNNSASASFTVTTADVSILKTINNSTPNQGQTVSYTLKVTNTGPSGVTGMEVIDTIPLGETFGTVTTLPSGTWTYDNVTRIFKWTIPSLALTNQSLVFTATINSGTSTMTIKNNAYISKLDQVDLNLANNKSSASLTVNSQDIRVTKTVNVTAPDEHTNVVYTINATNLLGGDVSALSILDTLPTGTSFVSYIADAGTYDPATGIWNVGVLADLASVNLYITASINGGTSGKNIVNTARYISSNSADNVPANNSASATLTVTTADLSILKTVSNNNPVETQTVSYTLKVTNAGPSVATNVEIIDTIRAGLTFGTVTTLPAGSWAYDATTKILKWTIPSLLVTNKSLVYTATLNSGTATQTIRNSAYISKLDQLDNIPANNNSTVNLTVKPQDIQVTKTVNNAAPDEGNNVVYTITVTNISGVDASSLSVLDTLPTGMTYVSYSADAGTYNPATGIWNVGSLALLANKNLYITAKVNAGTSGTAISNTARYVSSTPSDNNTANNVASASLTVSMMDIKLVKTVDDITPDEGQTITYSVKLTNSGPSIATNITVTDTIPAGFNFSTVTSLPSGSWLYDSVTRALSWNIPSIAAVTNYTLQFTVKVGKNTSSKIISNTAAITKHDQVDILASNDKSSVSVTVNTIDIGLVKTVDDNTPDEGQTITYSLKITNAGVGPANNVVIKDTIPADLNFVAFANAPIGSYAYDSITKICTWTIPSIAALTNSTLQISVKVGPNTSSKTITNRALIFTHDQVDVTPANDKASVAITVNTIDISLAKTVDDNKPDEGQTITYSIKLSNSISSAANNIVVTDTIPATLTFAGFANTPIGSWTYDSITKICRWTIPTIAAGANATLQILAVVNTNTSSKTLVNTARISSHDQVDINAANDKSSVSVTVNTIDISLTKTVDDNTPNEGQVITYSIKLSNLGVGVANNITITDTIPANLTFGSVTAIPSGTWSYDPILKVLSWNVSSILAAANSTLQFTALVAANTSSKTINNTAAITKHDQVDLVPANDKSSTSVVVNTMDLSVSKTVDDLTPDEGQTVNYSITLSNGIGSFANNIVVKDTIPVGITFQTVSTLPTGTWAYDPTTKVLTWDVPTIASAGSYALTFSAKVNANTSSKTISNSAFISAHDQVDINPANDKSSVSFTVNTIDISLLKTVDDATAEEGQTLNYSIKATNAGLGTATNIVMNDTIPADVTFVAVTSAPSGSWTFNPATKVLQWILPTLASSANYTLQFTAKVNSGTSSKTIVNTASMISHDQVDINPVNDRSSVSVIVNTIDITLLKTVDDATPDEKQTLSYSLKITNSGAGIATNIVITDTIPSGISFLTVGSLPTGSWAYDTTTKVLTWNIPSVLPAGTYTLQFTASVNDNTSSRTIVNTASMTKHDEVDINSANDKSSVSVLVNTIELSVVKSVDDNTPDEGQTITYSLKVANAGLGMATNIVVSDTIPSGVTFSTVTSLPAGTWVLDSSSRIFTWSIPSLATLANYTLQFAVKVNKNTSSTSITNTATIRNHDQVDVNPVNDRSSVTVTVNTIDISIIKTVNDNTPDEGEVITYSVKLSNLGVGVSNNIVITDTIPAGLSFLTVTNSPIGSWVYDSSTRVCTWTVASIAASANSTLQFTAKVNKNTSGKVISNSAGIVLHDQVDINPANDKSSVSVTVRTIDISLTKTVDDVMPDEGQTIVYSLKLANLGAGVANNITITDTIPAGLSFITVVNSVAGSWTYDSSTRVCTWTVPSIPAAKNDTLKFSVKVNSGTSSKTIPNLASIMSHDQVDINGANDKSSVSVVVNVIDIGLTKTVDDVTPDEGQTLTYSIKLTNAGAGVSNNVTVTDTIPAGLTFITVVNTPLGAWLYDSTARVCTWTIPAIAAGTNSTLQFTAKVDKNTSGQTIQNAATIVNHDQIDVTPANDRSVVGVVVNTIDIGVSKTVDDVTPDEGEVITYSIKLSNNGVGVANTVSISDTIPSDLAFVNVTVLPTGTWSYDAVTKILKWNIPSIVNGTSSTLKFTAKVNAGTSSKTIVNTAEITNRDQVDISPLNDKSSVSVTVRTVDISVVKTVNDNTADEGQTLTYSVKVANAGPSFTTNVVMRDTLPAGLSFINVTTLPTGSWSYDATSRILTWNIPAIASASNYTLAFTAKVNTGTSSQTITNTAVITNHDQVDPTPANDKSSISVVVNTIDIGVTKTVNDNTPNEGATLTYSIKLSNTGVGVANNIIISDTIPAGLTFQTVTAIPAGSWVFNAAAKVLTWTVPSISAGTNSTLQFTAKVNAGTSAQTIPNTAVIASHDQVDVTPLNDNSTASIVVNAFDITVLKTVDDNTPDEGQTITYSLKLTNTGPSFANNVVVNDTLSAGLTFVSTTAVPLGTASYNAANRILTWSIPTMSSGPSSTLQFTAKVNAGTSGQVISNAATLTAHDQVDNNDANNRSVVPVTVNGFDITVLKTVDDNTPDEGQLLTYSVKFTNAGPSFANNVVMSDTIPDGLTFQGVTVIPTGTQSYNSITRVLTWNIPAISSGANYTLKFTAKVNALTSSQTIVNTAVMSGYDQTDLNASNNQSSVAVVVNTVDIVMTKSVNDVTPDEGQIITYSIKAANAGLGDASNVVVNDTLPAGLTFVSLGTIPAGTTAAYNITTKIISWNIPAIAAPGNYTLTFTAKVNTGMAAKTITNSASMISVGQVDENPANNSSSKDVVVNGSDLQIDKTIDNTNGVGLGDTVTYTITLTNNGPLAASGIKVADALSSKLTLISATATKSTYSAGTWGPTNLNLNAGTSATLTIKAKVNSTATYSNVVNIASISSSPQPDGIANNNADTVSIYVAGSDLAVTKTVDKPSPISESDTLTYTVTLKNNGPLAANDIRITDVLPTTLTYYSSSATKSIYNQFTGVWGTDNNLDLASGETQTLTLLATVNTGNANKTFTNTASVTTSSQADNITTNNSASVTTTVGAADLSITKTVDKISPKVGDTLTYVITVTNNGPMLSNDVKIKDSLPAGLTYLSSVATEASYVSTTGIWGSINNLDLINGETRTLTIKAKVNSVAPGTVFLNTAKIIYASQGDGDQTNNTASVTSSVGSADLSVTNTVSANLLYTGAPVTYTITLSNNGPTAAAGFSVSDALPSGMTFTSANATLGSYNASTGLWSFGASQLANGSSATLTINANVGAWTEGKVISNKAYVTVTQQGNTFTNDTSVSVLRVHGADLQVTNVVNNSSPVEGSPIVYTITVTNNGPDTATGIQLRDDISLALIFISSSATQGSYNSSTNIWSGISLAPGASATLTLNNTLREAQEVDNTASIVASSQPDGLTENNYATAILYAKKNFAAGSAIIDMGVTPQTYNNGLKPYGLIYEMVITKKIPVYWVINPNKTFVNANSKTDQVDFTVSGKNYRAGAFVVSAEFVPAVLSTMNAWIAANPGLTIDFNRPAFTAPIHALITSFPRAVLDAQNGDKIRDAFYVRAGVSDSSYRNDGAPSNLGACDDIYAMPHADPQNWVKMEKDTLFKFINNGGWMWAACHAVSAIETLVDVNGDGVGDMNYLSNGGLIPWGQHSGGSEPYQYNIGKGLLAPSIASDPYMQFIGTFDGALQNGSEQIYIPFPLGWRNTTVLAVTNSTQKEVVDGTYNGPAVAAAYGRAFGDPYKGMLMYEASHSIAGGSESENVASARMYGNFLLEAGVSFKPQIATNTFPDTLRSGVGMTFSVTSKGKALPLQYIWSADCGGTFTSQNGPTTTFIPPGVNAPTSCIIRIAVSDACGRKNFVARMVTILPQADLSIVKTAPGTVKGGSTMQYTLTVKNNGPSNVSDAYVRDTLSAGLINATYKLNGGLSTPFPASDSIYIGAMAAQDSAKIVVTVTVQPGICSTVKNTAYVRSSMMDSVSANNTSSVVTTVLDTIAPVLSCPSVPGAFCNLSDVVKYTTYSQFVTAGGTASDNCGLDTTTFTWVSDVTAGIIVTRTYSIRDISGNTATCSQSINVNPKPVITLIAGPTCLSNQSAYSIVMTITSGTAPFTATATVGTVSVSGNIITLSDVPTGVGSIVAVTDAKSCQATYAKTPYTCGNCPVTAAIVSSDADNIICKGESFELSGSASGGVLPYIYTWSPNIGSGAGPFTVSPSATTTYRLIVKDDNGNGCADTTQLTVTVNSNPNVTAALSQSAVCRTQSSVLSYAPSAGLSTVGWFVTDASCNLSGGSLGNTTTLTVAPSSTTSYGVVVQDANSCRDTSCISLTILNCLPQANRDLASTDEDVAVIIPVMANDTFGGNGPSTGTISIITNAHHGNAAVNDGATPINPLDDQITYTPNSDYHGMDTLVYRICDSDGDCDTAIVYITINSVNDLPLADADNATVNEDASVTISVLANDNFGGDGPSTGSITITGNANHGTATVSNGGTPNDPTDDKVVYTPNANYNGNDTLIYNICDSDGDCDTAIVYITITPVNDLPVANADNASVNEDSVVTIPVLVNDDFGGDGPSAGTITIIDNTDHGVSTVNDGGTPSDPTDDQIVYTPNADYNGTDVLIYQVCDINGDCDTAIVHITVNPVNDLPLANADNASVNEDSSVTIDVLTNDTFGGDGPSTGTIAVTSGASHGSVSVDDNGTPNDPTDDHIIYTPDADYNGSDAFIYQVCDANGDCDTAIVNIIVTPVNDLPVADADAAQVDEDSNVSIDVLTNDTFGGDGPSTGAVIITDNPHHGTAVVNKGGTQNNPTDDKIVYTPSADYNGKDTLIYRICDSNGDCDTAIVFITVNSVDDIPTANADHATVLEDSSVVITVLTNDTFGGDGPVVGPIGIDTDPSHGTATVDDGGTPNDPTDDQIIYTPADGYNGMDTLVYVICDDDEDCDTAMVYIKVTSVNDLPLANADNAAVDEDADVIIPVLVNDTFGGDGPSVGPITITENSNHGTAAVNNGGTPDDPTDDQIVYTPNPDYSGLDTLIYQICDEDGDCDTAIVYITVNGVNDAPIAADDVDTTCEDIATSGNVAANDSDIDGAVVNITLVSGPNNGTIILNADGSYVYTPAQDYHGNDTVVYSYCDLGTPDLCDTATLYILVTPVNDSSAHDLTVQCDGTGNPDELVEWLASNGGASNGDTCYNCTWSNDFTTMTQGCGATGNVTVTFTLTYECGSRNTTATFAIVDTTRPTIKINAAGMAVQCDGSGNTADLQSWLSSNGGAVAFDLCSNVTWSNDFTALSPACGGTGSATVTFTASDDCGNKSTTQATFTIADTTKPAITVDASDLTVECDGAGDTTALQSWLASNGGASASDICGSVTWSNNFTAMTGACGGTGSATVTFTATDDCGNSSTTQATFTIADTTKPAITINASDLTVECDGSGDTTALQSWLSSNGGAAANDICGSVTWSNNFTAITGACGGTGSASVTFTATDDCGNSSTTRATFTIADTTKPAITVNASDLTVECDGSGDTTALQSWLSSNGGASANDICGSVTWSNNFTAITGACGGTGSSTVIFTATDDCGNSSTTQATFTIADTTKPSIAVNPSDLTVECDGSGDTTAINAWLASNGGASANDICGSVTWSNDFTAITGACGGTGSATVTFTATDDCGNMSTAQASITIIDTIKPTITINASDMTVECDGSGDTTALNAWLASNGGASATDICGSVTWSNDFTAITGACGGTGSSTVTFTATDDCGNSSTTQATFTIADTTKPVFVGVLPVNATVCGSVSSAPVLTATDNCGTATVTMTETIDSVSTPGDIIYTRTWTASDECSNSSSHTQTIIVHPVFDITVDSTICEGHSVTMGANAYSLTGSYTSVLSSASGCDSTVHLNLTVNPVKHTDVNAVICSGEQVTVGGQVFTTSVTNYVMTLSSSLGCDSIITLNLVVLKEDTIVSNRTICAGDFVSVGDSTFTQAGTFYIPFLNNQCTGMVQLNLTVNQPTASTQNKSICEGDVAVIGGHVFNTSGTYAITVQNSLGCDSVITLNLTVNPKMNTTVDSVICRGDSVVVGTQSFTTTGTYQVMLNTAAGCDSNVTLNLIVLMSGDTTVVNQSICQGDSASVGGMVFTSAGTYYINSPNGKCTNIIELHLDVRSVSTTIITQAICRGEAIVVGGQTFTATGTYTITLQNSVGCDSIITLNLNVSQGGVKSSLDTTICEGNSVTFAGQTFSTTGTYQIVYPSGVCRDTMMLTVHVNPVYDITVDTTICEGNIVMLGTNAYSLTGTYTGILTSAQGCDSTVHLNLTVNPVKHTDVNAVICSGEQVIVGGQTFDTSVSNYIMTLSSSKGCDSIITLNLVVLKEDTIISDRTICDGDFVSVGDSTFTEAGTYYIPFVNNQCTGIVQLNLTVNQPTASVINGAMCEGDVAVIEGQVFTTSGSYTITTQNSLGCDSVITFNLTVNPIQNTTVDSVICRGETVTIGTQSFNVTGTYHVLLMSSAGCDSNVTLNLIVLTSGDTTFVNQSICAGDSASVGGQTFTTAGTYYINSPNGRCTNIIALTLDVRPVSTTTITQAMCRGEAIVVGGQTFTATGTYTITLQNSVGCDSIITLNLDVSQGGVKSSLDTTICEGGSVTYAGQTFSTSGTYQIVYPSGICRDTMMLTVHVNPVKRTTQSLTICQGASITVGTAVHNQTGIYTDTLRTSKGCDSIVTTNLTVNPVITTSQNIVLCAGESIAVGAVSHNQTGIYTDTLQTSKGCDSIVTTNLLVNDVKTRSQNLTICEGETVIVGTSVYNSTGTYIDTLQSASGCDSIVTTVITANSIKSFAQTISICAGETLTVGASVYNQSGTYIDTLQAATGCDSVIKTMLTVNSVFNVTVDTAICQGNNITVGGTPYSIPGNYTVSLQSVHGCDSIVHLNLTVNPVITTTIDSAICRGESVTIGTHTFDTTGNYQVLLTNATGCDSTVILRLTVLQSGDTTKLHQSICDGDSIVVAGQTLTTAGVHYITTSNGQCFSIVEVTLDVKSMSQIITIDTVICRGESVVIGGQTFIATGVYTINLQNSVGCDSSIILNLNASQTGTKTTVDTTVCYNETVTYQGQVFNASGTYQLVSPAGACKDTMVLHLTVKPAPIIIDTTICQSDSLMINGQIFRTRGKHRLVVPDAASCDSIIWNITVKVCVDTTSLTLVDTTRDTLIVRTTEPFCNIISSPIDSVTVTACDGSTAGTSSYGTWSIDASGCLIYTAGPIKGVDTLCIKSCDKQVVTSCTETTVIITVAGIPPTAETDSIKTDPNTPVVIHILNNDTTYDEDPLTLCDPSAVITSPSHGTATVNPDGTITYSPVTGYSGVDSFQYQICDPEGSDTAWVYIRIVGCEIPNAFSPNGDGINDVFIIPCGQGDISFNVYNRWGIEVYRSDLYHNDWDGKYKGSPLPDGTYYYVVKYNTDKGEEVNKAGFITLHR